jgi:hypothetical protein
MAELWMALGAQQVELKRMFVGRCLLWSGIGAAAALSKLMSALLFEINPLDPLTYTVAAVGILAAAVPVTCHRVRSRVWILSKLCGQSKNTPGRVICHRLRFRRWNY